ncbi:serine/threonine-protein kinase dkf-2-like [Panulirus ornatus]|uniref:serine/threonine-protein kinase dkf-2-like n=1 Tax=Panulirus ornatus TaxID=150431 RepID=UPI003A8AA13C
MTVAVKEYISDNDTTEVQSLWELDGAGGVPKLYGVTSTTPMALVMELVPGERLSSFSSRSLDKCLKAFIATCAALEEIHEARYVHCDLHSDNILISSRDDGGIISRIIDVGLARNLNIVPTSEQEGLVEMDYEMMVSLAKVLIARKVRKPLQSLFVFKRQLSSLREGAEMFLRAQQ